MPALLERAPFPQACATSGVSRFRELDYGTLLEHIPPSLITSPNAPYIMDCVQEYQLLLTRTQIGMRRGILYEDDYVHFGRSVELEVSSLPERDQPRARFDRYQKRKVYEESLSPLAGKTRQLARETLMGVARFHPEFARFLEESFEDIPRENSQEKLSAVGFTKAA